jgi:PIN domain nuclease of toxin-antitoxin system
MPAVLDTHALIWWVTEDRRLSARARTAVGRAAARGELFVSMISLWEIAKLVEKGQLAFNQPLDAWLDAALATTGLQVAELTQRILLDSCRLPPPFHDDPADQIIVSTTRVLSATLITRDARLRDYPHVRSAW